jgi:hypothetical protein
MNTSYYRAKFEREAKRKPSEWAIDNAGRLVPLTDAARAEQRAGYVGCSVMGYQF